MCLNRKCLNRKYFLKSITDLCSSGSDKKNIEFRLTEVKASMRFWWRALNYYDDAQKLWKDERKIFGDGDSIKSPIVFRLLNEDKESNGCYGKHIVGWDYKNNIGRSIKCISPGKEISFEMSLYKRKIPEKDFTDKSISFYDSLLKLSFILGGIGKRSRRGCGAFYISDKYDCDHKITSINIYNNIIRFMKNIGIDNYYNFSNNGSLIISRKKVDCNLEYPYIEQVMISSRVISENDFYVNKIKRAIDECKKDKINYKVSDGRLACPVYVTCYGDDRDRIIPIIVKLHNTSKISGQNYDDSKYYNKFKEMIL
ncbi:type III-B CRISPR module RAMP protein Cmr1 [Clostridium fermenticellae]|uniref:Type III-B CRISPR module RAMP protein Cmr1 n=1 Tax=Clostridium fermenticellae TaxID=2068654 RepID=A0A386H3E6_9CLOT|nr:type III-B CRISPR module RAMP protein Cmr1 [Clostridium fermenticellae]AYD40241.1 type III-B CRISPR module RAMP protein Cmr1 [Clostridium fermenticellae]